MSISIEKIGSVGVAYDTKNQRKIAYADTKEDLEPELLKEIINKGIELGSNCIDDCLDEDIVEKNVPLEIYNNMIKNMMIRETTEVDELTKEKNDIIHRIFEEIPFVDIKPYSHNIININLKILADKFGDAEAKKLIRNTKLKDMGWGCWVE